MAATSAKSELRALLAGAKYPARSPDVNVADIKAQVAANEKGVQELQRVVALYGWPTVSAYMLHVMNNAEESVRRVIDRLGSGSFEYTMDSGLPLCVSVSVERASRSAVVDFSGTGHQSESNFNSPPAVTRAAVLYVFRTSGGRRYPAERRLPEAAASDHSAGNIPLAASGRGGGGGQHGGVAGNLQCAVRCTETDRVLAGDDEQLPVR